MSTIPIQLVARAKEEVERKALEEVAAAKKLKMRHVMTQTVSSPPSTSNFAVSCSIGAGGGASLEEQDLIDHHPGRTPPGQMDIDTLLGFSKGV